MEPKPIDIPAVPESNANHENHAEAGKDLADQALEKTVVLDINEVANDTEIIKKTSSETAAMIDEYVEKNGSVRGLSMKDLVEEGFDPNMTLRRIGNERIEDTLKATNNRYRVERGTDGWAKMEEIEARNVPMSDDEIDAVLEAGADPQHIVDALQRTEPEDGVDNPSSSRIALRLDKLVEAGLPPAILAARLNPSWRESVRDQLDESQIKWHEANRRKAIT